MYRDPFQNPFQIYNSLEQYFLTNYDYSKEKTTLDKKVEVVATKIFDKYARRDEVAGMVNYLEQYLLTINPFFIDPCLKRRKELKSIAKAFIKLDKTVPEIDTSVTDPLQLQTITLWRALKDYTDGNQ